MSNIEVPFYKRHAQYLDDHRYDGMPPRGISFDDVLTQPSYSTITSRRSPEEISLKTHVAKGVEVNSPIMTANMDTITEWQMAQEIAALGGVGVIHRYLTAEVQAEHVRMVKERTRAMEDTPLWIHPEATVKDIKALWRRHKRGYVLVKNLEGELLGIVTNKDVDSAERETDQAITFMTPRDILISVQEGTTIEQAEEIMKRQKIEKVPVVKDGQVVGVYTRKDSELFRKYPNASRDEKGRLIVGAAIGVKDIEAEVERAYKLVEAGVDFIVVDIAHGDSINMIQMLKRLAVEKGINVPIIAGNIATGDAAKRLIDEGVKGVKVGIGPGYACDTRVIAGVGKPQISAIASVAAVAVDQGIVVIADGGTRCPGDFVKALVAGADIVMGGGIFAGAIETPGKVITVGDRKYKRYEGMASNAARERANAIQQQGTIYEDRFSMTEDDSAQAAPEGREKMVPLIGPVRERYRWIEAGVRSGASYIDAVTIPEMRIKGEFIGVTQAGANEQYRNIG